MTPANTWIKICGITSKEDAAMAMDAGADYLGFIRVDSSPRSVSVEQARDIAQFVGKSALTVGVYENPTEKQLKEEHTLTQWDCIQLHGNEPPELLTQCPVPVIKVLTLGNQLTQATLNMYQACPNLACWLFDLPKQADSSITPLEAFQHLPLFNLYQKPYFLAGKLTPENVTDILTRFAPDGVDVASGVEARKGQKDPEKIRVFCNNVRNNKC
jgi:phosphoribosylanthranilate isomerase